MVESDNGLGRALLEAFGRFNRALHLNAHRNLAPGQKPGQLFVMGAIKRHGPADASGLRVSDLAARLGVTASSVTQMVTELETRGLVRRDMDDTDRRAVRVKLTEEGDRLMSGFFSPFEASLGALVERLGEEKCRTLLDLLGEVDVFFAETRDAPTSGQAQATQDSGSPHDKRGQEPRHMETT